MAEPKVMWPRSWEGVILWRRPNPDGGATEVFWSIPDQVWKPVTRGDVIMSSGDATEEELVAAGLDPKDFK